MRSRALSLSRGSGTASVLAVVAALSAFAPHPFIYPASADDPAPGPVDPAGNMRVPDDYRTAYEYLGSWAVAGTEKGSKQIHTVFASPGAVASYRKTGHFPDGTVLVKEVFDASTGLMTTGTVSHEDKLEGWFMMIKDGRNSHPGNKLWGEGWGWSWFDAANPIKTTSTDFRVNCLGCHVPAKSTDWIYVSGYPALRR